MEKPADIIARVGKDRAAIALNVGAATIDKALSRGRLPPAWFDTLEVLAGESLPRDCFSFKGAA